MLIYAVKNAHVCFCITYKKENVRVCNHAHHVVCRPTDGEPIAACALAPAVRVCMCVCVCVCVCVC